MNKKNNLIIICFLSAIIAIALSFSGKNPYLNLFILLLIPISIIQYFSIENKIKKDEGKKAYNKISFFFGAVILMSFAQAILSYTPRVGMSPIDSLIQSTAYLLNTGYSLINYYAVYLLVFTAIVLSKPEDKIKVSTSFVTGYALAYLVQIVAFYILPMLSFAGLMWDAENHNGKTASIYFGLLWFSLGFIALCLSIGMWVSSQIALRPYEIFIIKMQEKTLLSFSNLRIIFDLSFAILALLVSLIASSVYENIFILDSLTIGLGTIVFIVFCGRLSEVFISLFSRYM